MEKMTYTKGTIFTQRTACQGMPELWYNPDRSNPFVRGKVVAWGHGFCSLNEPCEETTQSFRGLKG